MYKYYESTSVYTDTQNRHMDVICHNNQAVASGGAGGLEPSQFLAKQLNLSQPEGQIMPTTVLQAPSNVQTLRRPWN